MGQRFKGEVIDTTFPVAKRGPEKIQASTGFKPLDFVIKVECSTKKVLW